MGLISIFRWLGCMFNDSFTLVMQSRNVSTCHLFYFIFSRGRVFIRIWDISNSKLHLRWRLLACKEIASKCPLLLFTLHSEVNCQQLPRHYIWTMQVACQDLLEGWEPCLHAQWCHSMSHFFVPQFLSPDTLAPLQQTPAYALPWRLISIVQECILVNNRTNLRYC